MDSGPCHMQTQEIEPEKQPFRPAIPPHKIKASAYFVQTEMADDSILRVHL